MGMPPTIFRLRECSSVLFSLMKVCRIFRQTFMPRAAELVRKAGGVFIADEVQAGFCRTGRWWGYEVSGFVPDIATMGKPMGNGMPLAGVTAAKEQVDVFRKNTSYFNTFASSPLQAAVGMAVIDVIEQEDLCANVVDVGTHLRMALEDLQKNCEPMGGHPWLWFGYWPRLGQGP